MTDSVSFLWPHPVSGLAPEEVDQRPEAIQTGEEAWVLQTCLRLQAAGERAALTPEPCDGGILVYHARHRRLVAGLRGRRGGPLLVAVRGERSRPLLAHVEVVQNGRGANRRRRYFLPHWPQPGLERRDPARGDRLERIAYMGRELNLHRDFTTDYWRRALADLGIEWAVEDAASWHRYSTVDAVLAVRPRGYKGRLKPATKLQNAWLAGIPAILGPQPAFRELRQDELDYLEAGDLRSALDAVRRLMDPSTYRRFSERGRERAPAFGTAACLERWRRLLYDELPARAAELNRKAPQRRGMLPFGRHWALSE